MRLASCLMVLIVGLVLVPSAVPGAAAVQPCDKLLTVQDITSVLGPGFTLVPAPVSGPKACIYGRKRSGESEISDRVSLTLRDEPGGAAQKLAELSKSDMVNSYRSQGVPVKPASDLGTGAFYIDSPDIPLNFLLFGKGNVVLTLGAWTDKKPNTKAALTLGKAVYARL